MASASLLVRAPVAASSFLGAASARQALRAPCGVPSLPVRGAQALKVSAQFIDGDKAKNEAAKTVKDAASSAQKAWDSNSVTQQAGQKVQSDVQTTLRDSGALGTSGTFGFTKRNELFVGRMAMLGFASALVGEWLTGKGALGQFDIETGIAPEQAVPLLIAFISSTVFFAFVGGKGQQGQTEANPRQPAETRNVRGFFGLAQRGPLFGFTRQNEYFNGRLAQLGFVASLVGELATGYGPAGQVAQWTGIPSHLVLGAFMLLIPSMLVASVNLGEGRFVNNEDVDVY